MHPTPAYLFGAAAASAVGTKTASDDLQRALTAAFVSAGGGLALGSYPGWKLQQLSAQAGNPDFVNALVGKLPIAAGSALTGGLYNYLSRQADAKKKKTHNLAAQPT